MSSQDRLQQHRALNPKQSGVGRTSNSGIAGTNLVNLDPDDTNISSASQVRPDKTTSESHARQTSESNRETPDESQIGSTSSVEDQEQKNRDQGETTDEEEDDNLTEMMCMFDTLSESSQAFLLEYAGYDPLTFNEEKDSKFFTIISKPCVDDQKAKIIDKVKSLFTKIKETGDTYTDYNEFSMAIFLGSGVNKPQTDFEHLMIRVAESALSRAYLIALRRLLKLPKSEEPKQVDMPNVQRMTAAPPPIPDDWRDHPSNKDYNALSIRLTSEAITAKIKQGQKKQSLDGALAAAENFLEQTWVAALRKKKSEAEEKLSKIKDKIDETKKEHEYKMEKLINEEKFLSRKKDDAATEYSKVFERNSYKEMKKKAEDANEALQAAKTTSKKIFDEHAEAGQALCDSIKEEYGEEKGPTLETLTRRFREEVISRATASLGGAKKREGGETSGSATDASKRPKKQVRHPARTLTSHGGSMPDRPLRFPIGTVNRRDLRPLGQQHRRGPRRQRCSMPDAPSAHARTHCDGRGESTSSVWAGMLAPGHERANGPPSGLAPIPSVPLLDSLANHSVLSGEQLMLAVAYVWAVPIRELNRLATVL